MLSEVSGRIVVAIGIVRAGKYAVVFNSIDVSYFAVLWSLAFVAGLARTLRDRSYINPWDCITIGAVGGFYGFAVVSVCSYYGPSIADFGWGYIGIAIAVGSLGKEQDKIMRAIFSKFLGRFLDDEPKQ